MYELFPVVVCLWAFAAVYCATLPEQFRARGSHYQRHALLLLRPGGAGHEGLCAGPGRTASTSWCVCFFYFLAGGQGEILNGFTPLITVNLFRGTNC